MDIILGHQNHDFDCVASMVAVKKLYPEAKIFLQPTAEGGVLEFLNLYRNHFSFFKYSEYREQDIDRLIVVDTNSRDRLGPYVELLERADKVIVYDHHPPENATIEADEYNFDEAGALITILIEKIRERQLIPNDFEATLFMLGLHQETGGLQFGTTGPRDYEAGRFLLEAGADLDLVQNFCHRRLTDQQRELFRELLDNSRNISINNVPVTLSTAHREEYIPEIALLAHKLRDTENANLICLLVQMGSRIQLVIRNRYSHVDAGAIADQFGGGGHKRAASATLSGVTLEEAREALVNHLNEKLKPELVASNIMTTPVHSIRPDLPVKEAHEVMLRLGHHGLPITDEDNKLIGIITRSDVDKAIDHELTHAPVKGFMTPDVVTIDPDLGLQEIQNVMMSNQIGRLPVVKENRLVGIVTRTDLIRVLHERHQPSREEQFQQPPAYSSIQNPDNIESLLKQILERKWYRRLKEWGELCNQWDDTIFLVGGCVRDILMEESTKDFDLVVENDGIKFARHLVSKVGGEVSVHKKFGTAVITLPDGDKVDVATARSEYYSHPAALPRVELKHASVYQDLQRRDFTINAMAVNLSPGFFGDLLDFYGGRQDIEEGRIRILYSTSFLDDPTRIFRAIRFASRFDFKIGQKTNFQLRQAVEGRPFEPVSGDRLREELFMIFQEEEPWKIVNNLAEYEVLTSLHSGLELDKKMKVWFDNTHKLLSKYNPNRPELIYLCLFSDSLSAEEARRFGQRLTLSSSNLAILENYHQGLIKTDKLKKADKKSEIYQTLDNIGNGEVLLALRARLPEELSKKIQIYQDELCRQQPLINGKDLQKWGMKPGPELGGLLKKLFLQQLDMPEPTREKLKRKLQYEKPGLDIS
ncbi:MAG: CBS domain-containing protein [bacterium]